MKIFRDMVIGVLALTPLALDTQVARAQPRPQQRPNRPIVLPGCPATNTFARPTVIHLNNIALSNADLIRAAGVGGLGLSGTGTLSGRVELRDGFPVVITQNRGTREEVAFELYRNSGNTRIRVTEADARAFIGKDVRITGTISKPNNYRGRMDGTRIELDNVLLPAPIRAETGTGGTGPASRPSITRAEVAPTDLRLNTATTGTLRGRLVSEGTGTSQRFFLVVNRGAANELRLSVDASVDRAKGFIDKDVMVTGSITKTGDKTGTITGAQLEGARPVASTGGTGATGSGTTGTGTTGTGTTGTGTTGTGTTGTGTTGTGTTGTGTTGTGTTGTGTTGTGTTGTGTTGSGGTALPATPARPLLATFNAKSTWTNPLEQQIIAFINRRLETTGTTSVRFNASRTQVERLVVGTPPAQLGKTPGEDAEPRLATDVQTMIGDLKLRKVTQDPRATVQVYEQLVPVERALGGGRFAQTTAPAFLKTRLHYDLDGKWLGFDSLSVATNSLPKSLKIGALTKEDVLVLFKARLRGVGENFDAAKVLGAREGVFVPMKKSGDADVPDAARARTAWEIIYAPDDAAPRAYFLDADDGRLLAYEDVELSLLRVPEPAAKGTGSTGSGGSGSTGTGTGGTGTTGTGGGTGMGPMRP